LSTVAQSAKVDLLNQLTRFGWQANPR